MNSKNEKQSAADFVERVRVNQRELRSDLKAQYDLIVCRSGWSGSVVARRMAENPDVRTAEELAPSVLAFKADVTDPVAIAQAVEATVEPFGRLEIFVANAGIKGLERRVSPKLIEGRSFYVKSLIHYRKFQ
jgi:short chain dehydrogenase